LRLVRREQALAFEKANLPAEAWPPTPWYERWASGTNAFPMVHREPPIELVWLVATQAEGA
jgi:hypothetical protein